jgi:hypothetical protein
VILNRMDFERIWRFLRKVLCCDDVKYFHVVFEMALSSHLHFEYTFVFWMLEGEMEVETRHFFVDLCWVCMYSCVWPDFPL